MDGHTTALRIILAMALGAGIALRPAIGSGQSLEEGLGLYESKSYAEAALRFYDCLRHDAEVDRRDRAEIYLADTLRQMGFLISSLFYYKDIFEQTHSNRYYLNALEGLLAVRKQLHDPVLVPTLLHAHFDAAGVAGLDPHRVAEVDLLVGEVAFHRQENDGARQSLLRVPPESPFYAKARYLLGVLAVRAGDHAGALEQFVGIQGHLAAPGMDKQQVEIKDLSVLAEARTAYGLGEYRRAAQLFSKVPRFSRQWFTALYEGGWAHFKIAEHAVDLRQQAEAYGRALGELQSVLSPYFAHRHAPEAYVLMATTYFVNCQWDRVRAAVAAFRAHYEPVAQALDAYLDQERQPRTFYEDLVDAGAGHYDARIAREVRGRKRFKDLHHMLRQAAWEGEEISRQPGWPGSSLAEDLNLILAKQREGLETVVGAYVRQRLRDAGRSLKHLGNQIDILDFEVSDAERKYLEQGKEILKGRRPRLPRPDIPNDQWQHWKLRGEFWKDELGYYRHSLRSECF